MTKWKGETAIEFCEDPDRLLRFITNRLPQIHEEGIGVPHEEAQFCQAVGRLIELAAQGLLPAQWQRTHLKRLTAMVRPIKEIP